MAAAGLALVSACARDAATTLSPTLAGIRADADQAAAPVTIVAERFTRTTGAPNEFSRTIATADYEAPFTLTVTNGDGTQRSTVSSASVSLDGITLLGPSDFSKQGGTKTFSPSLGATAALNVSLASAPGSFLEITLTGRRRTYHVCPGVPAAYQTVAAAVADAPAGATISLCDGVHAVESVIIDKPLTITADDGAEPVVRNSTTTGALVISGPASGTVSIDGIAFDNQAGPRDNANRLAGSFSVRSTGSALDVSVTNSSFATTTAGNGGIAFTNNAATLDVTSSSFTGGLFGIYADAAGTTNVRGSAFHAHANFGGRLGAANVVVDGNTADHCQGTCWVVINANASITNNTAYDCGSTACASASNSVATIADNRFSNRITIGNFPGAHATIYFFGGSHGLIANNVIDGCGYGQCIMMFETRGEVAEVRNNAITVYVGDRTRIGIIAGDGAFGNSPQTNLGATANIHDNTIVVSGINNPAAAPQDTLSWAMMYGAIHVEGHSVVTADRNSATNAQFGILARTGSQVSGSDNRFDLNRFGVLVDGAGSQATIHRSDFTRSLERSLATGPGTTASLTCNYWGSAAGPFAPGSPLGPTTWTPFATQPIAGTSIACP